MSKGTRATSFIIGRMGDAVKVREANGRKIGSLRLAVTSGYGDKETTSWFDVVIFDEKKLDVIERYTGKGSRILVQGEQRVRKWTDNSGADRWSTETIISFDGVIELLDSKAESKGNANHDGNYGGSSTSSSSTRSGPPPMGSDIDDDVPF